MEEEYVIQLDNIQAPIIRVPTVMEDLQRLHPGMLLVTSYLGTPMWMPQFDNREVTIQLTRDKSPYEQKVLKQLTLLKLEEAELNKREQEAKKHINALLGFTSRLFPSLVIGGIARLLDLADYITNGNSGIVTDNLMSENPELAGALNFGFDLFGPATISKGATAASLTANNAFHNLLKKAYNLGRSLYISRALNKATPSTATIFGEVFLLPKVNIIRGDKKIKILLPSHTSERPREFVLEPLGDNKFYVHMRTWDDVENHVPASNLTNDEKQLLFESLYNELPEGAEILVPKSGEGFYATRGTIAGLQRLARDSRFIKGAPGVVWYDNGNNAIRSFNTTSFIKKPSTLRTPFFLRYSSKHLLPEDGSVVPLYTGRQYSVSDILNSDNSVNLEKLELILNESADFWGGNRMRARTENPVWHRTDPTTYHHTLNVTRSAWGMPVPEGYTRAQASLAAALHDAGKIFTGELHGPIGAAYFKLVFPDMDDAVYNAIATHMEQNPSGALALFVKKADIDNGTHAARISKEEWLGIPKGERNLKVKINPYGEVSDVDTYLINRSETPYDFLNGLLTWLPGNSRAGAKGRTTIHFTTDTPVIPHGSGSWDGVANTMLTPYKLVVSQNGFPINIDPMDTYFSNALPFRVPLENTKIFTSNPIYGNRYEFLGIPYETSKEALQAYMNIRRLLHKINLLEMQQAKLSPELSTLRDKLLNYLQDFNNAFDPNFDTKVEMMKKDIADMEAVISLNFKEQDELYYQMHPYEETNAAIHNLWARNNNGYPTKEVYDLMETEIGMPLGISGVHLGKLLRDYPWKVTNFPENPRYNPFIEYYHAPASHFGDWVYDSKFPEDKIEDFIYELIDPERYNGRFSNFRRGKQNYILLQKLILDNKNNPKVIKLLSDILNNKEIVDKLPEDVLLIFKGEMPYKYKQGGRIKRRIKL